VTPKQFRRFLDRDDGCVHCGETETVVPHHRLNRGMGGSKKLDHPANIIVMCSSYNTLMESNSKIADHARSQGWKLRTGDNPATTPVWSVKVMSFVLLTTDYDYQKIQGEQNANHTKPIHF